MTKEMEGFSVNYFSPENLYVHSWKEEKFKSLASSPPLHPTSSCMRFLTIKYLNLLKILLVGISILLLLHRGYPICSHLVTDICNL